MRFLTGLGWGALLGLLAGCQSLDTPKITDRAGKPLAGSVSELLALDLNGVRQYVLIRGQNAANPVLLRLHGGPGQAEMAAESVNRDLERDFVVVEWDQRGAGKSALSDAGYARLSLGQLVDDTLALSRYLRKRFGTPLVLMGHSWGSIVGLLAAEKEPSLYCGFISTGQIVNFSKGAAITYAALLDEARRRADAAAVQTLTGLGPPPYADANRRQKYFGLIDTLGVSWHSAVPFDRVGLMLRSPEYSWTEKFAYPAAAQKSFDALFPDLQAVNLEDHRDFQIPVFFFVGRWDRLAPYELAEHYIQDLRAPQKGIVVFENSAHFPQYEEPARFAAVVREVWRRLAPSTQTGGSR